MIAANDPWLFWVYVVTNTGIALLLGVAMPHLIVTTVRRTRYLHGWQKGMWYFVSGFSVWGSAYGLSAVNVWLGLWATDVYLNAFTLVFLFTMICYAYKRRHLLDHLYPEEDLIEEQHRTKALLRKMEAWDSATPCPRFETKNGVIQSANPAAYQLLEYSPNELIGRRSVDMIYPEDADRILQHHILPNTHTTYECRVVTRSGRVVFVEVKSTANPADPLSRMVFVLDITNYVEERDRRVRRSMMDKQGHDHQQIVADTLASISKYYSPIPGTYTPEA